MPPRRVKVDVYDDEGNKTTISFEGKVTRNKVLQILDLIEILGGVHVAEREESSNLSKFDRVKQIVDESFPVGPFKSQDVQTVYEDFFKEPIGLSTVSTYLARLTSHGFLIRSGSPANIYYKIKRGLPISER